MQLSESTPLLSWSLSSFIKNDHNKNTQNKEKEKESDDRDCVVEQVQWNPQKPCSFFVFDSHGYCYYFDLLVKVFSPVYIEWVGQSEGNGKNGNKGKNGHGSFGRNISNDVSRCRPGTKTVYIATTFRDKDKGTDSESKNEHENENENCINVSVRVLSKDLLPNVRGASETESAIYNEEIIFRDSMNSWAARISTPQITVLLKNLSAENKSDRK